MTSNLKMLQDFQLVDKRVTIIEYRFPNEISHRWNI